MMNSDELRSDELKSLPGQYGKEWKVYCKILQVSPTSRSNRQDDFYLNGFNQWLQLNVGYRYYCHMVKNV